MTISVNKKGDNSAIKLIVSPSLPLDSSIKSVTVGSKTAQYLIKQIGDIQQVEVSFDVTNTSTEIIYNYTEGTDVYWTTPNLVAGQENQGLRIIKSQARAEGLYLVLEGHSGKSYELKVNTDKRLKETDSVKITTNQMGEKTLNVKFEGNSGDYIKREITLPFEPIINPKGKKK
jgi:hypothetical protein